MSLYQYLNRIRRLDALIRRRSTGPPAELADKLNISERWLYNLLAELREDLNCPIRYSRRFRSYYYAQKGRLRLGFDLHTEIEEPVEPYNQRSVRGKGTRTCPVYLPIQNREKIESSRSSVVISPVIVPNSRSTALRSIERRSPVIPRLNPSMALFRCFRAFCRASL